MENGIAGKNCILIVDDDFINRELLKNIFSSQFTFEEAENGRAGLEQLLRHRDKLCAIILDVEMPEMTGLELLAEISAQGITEAIPTFLITAHDEGDLVENAYRYGVMDVVSKPVSAVIVKRRVKTVIELFSAREQLHATVSRQATMLVENAKAIDELHRGTIEALAAAIEFRDMESGQHVSRIYDMTKYILTHTDMGEGLTAAEIESIAQGSIMHDVGKIAISDVILNKPGRLTREEFEVMKQHTVKGAELLAQVANFQSHEVYLHTSDIARHHHERWDGNGYPDGLAGEAISVAAQVVSIVDVYDALVSERVYKAAPTPEKAVEMIRSGACGAFNPKLVACFLEAEPVIRQWYRDDRAEPDATTPLPTSVPGGTKEPEATSSNSVIDMMLLMTAIHSAYDMVISANLTRNTYRIIDYDRFLTHCADADGVFDDLIDSGATSVPVSHRREFHDTFCREHLLQAFYAGQKSVTLEHPQYSDDGQLHWVLTTVLFVKDNRAGEVLQITLSRYIDEDYAKREKTRQAITEAMHLAERANSAKYDFLSKVSHDIRTPLNAIKDFSRIIKENAGDADMVARTVEKLDKAGDSLMLLMHDVLDIARIERGKDEVHLEPMDLHAHGRMLYELFAGDMAAAGITFQAGGETLQDIVYCDERKLTRILMHMLANARKFTPAGGTITFGGTRVSGDGHSCTYRFFVRDTGVGMSADFQKRAFAQFEKERTSAESGISGSGLGLAIIKMLVERMGGRVELQSEPGKGTEIAVILTFRLVAEEVRRLGDGA